MTRLLPLLAAACVTLAGCDDRPSPPTGNVTESAAEAMQKPASPPSAPFEYSHENELLDFAYGWSAETSAVPELVARFTRQMRESQARLTTIARSDKAEREKSDFPFNAYSSETAITTAGQSPRLLSLQVDSGEFTGGAHPNHGTTALLWDRQLRREIKLVDLFTEPANRDRVLRQRWCDAIGAERAKRRGGEQIGGQFDECPGLDEIAVIPTDKDGDGRFERLMLIASPYVAGPYAEGDYEIELPVDAAFAAVLKAEYKPSFQPQ